MSFIWLILRKRQNSREMANQSERKQFVEMHTVSFFADVPRIFIVNTNCDKRCPVQLISTNDRFNYHRCKFVVNKQTFQSHYAENSAINLTEFDHYELKEEEEVSQNTRKKNLIVNSECLISCSLTLYNCSASLSRRRHLYAWSANTWIQFPLISHCDYSVCLLFLLRRVSIYLAKNQRQYVYYKQKQHITIWI